MMEEQLNRYLVSKKHPKDKEPYKKAWKSFGLRDYYRYYRRHYKVLNEIQFGQVIEVVNSLLRDKLLSGDTIKFPKSMGKLELRKWGTNVRLENNKVKTNRPIDWDATLKLWYEDKEAEQQKILIRREVKDVYSVAYIKTRADYKNRVFVKWTTARPLKRLIKDRIINQGLDALKLY